MKFNSRSLIIFVTYLLSIFVLSNTGATEKNYNQIYSEIISNQKFVSSLNKNKISLQNAAMLFLSTAQNIESLTGSVNWDGLALCLYGDFKTVVGGGVMSCYTTKKEYSIGMLAVGGINLSVGGAFLYISFKNPDQKKWCFKAAEVSWFEGLTGSLGAGAEAKCRFDRFFDFNHFLGVGDYIENGGWLTFIKIGAGAAMNLGYDALFIDEISRY